MDVPNDMKIGRVWFPRLKMQDRVSSSRIFNLRNNNPCYGLHLIVVIINIELVRSSYSPTSNKAHRFKYKKIGATNY